MQEQPFKNDANFEANQLHELLSSILRLFAKLNFQVVFWPMWKTSTQKLGIKIGISQKRTNIAM